MSEQAIPLSRLTAAIHDAFHGSSPCHCKGDGKLSEAELRRALFSEGVGGPAILPDKGRDSLSFDGPHAYRLLRGVNTYELRRHGVQSLGDLAKWGYHDLLKLPGCGPAFANRIERALAQVGALLADGDPALIEQVRQERDNERKTSDRPPPADMSDPKETRDTAAAALFELGESAARDGASLMRLGYRLARNKKVAGVMKKYVRSRQSFANEVERLRGPLAAIEQAESAREKVVKKPTRRMVVVTANQLDSVELRQTGPVERDYLRAVG